MITKADVIAKFKELQNKYYRPRGYMISTVPDEVSNEFHDSERSSQFTWHETHNPYASDQVHILSCHVLVPLMGRTFKIRLDRPLETEDRYEFESYFGFGGHCEGYTQSRIIVCYPENINDALCIDELLLNFNGHGPDPTVDHAYAKQVLMLLVLGGHVKYWKAVAEFEQWFITEVEIDVHATGNELRAHIFETMQPYLIH